jgi:hypothetical protein
VVEGGERVRMVRLGHKEKDGIGNRRRRKIGASK